MDLLNNLKKESNKFIKTKKFILIWIFPLILFILVFPIKGDVKDLGGGSWTFAEEDPSPKTLLRNLIESPFNLKWYVWCVQDIYLGIDIIDPITNETITHKELIINQFNVTINEGYEYKTISLGAGERYCEKFNSENHFSFNFSADTYSPYDPELLDVLELNENQSIKNIAPSIDFVQGVGVEFWTYLTKLILTYLSFWAIMFLILQLNKWYKIKNES